LTPFQQALQTDKKICPLRTAVMHELNFLSPAAMFEQQHYFTGLIINIEMVAGVEPLFWFRYAFPAYTR